MNVEFWQERWQNNEIGFHEGAPNLLLVSHFEKLHLNPGSRIFLPLCGKTVDIAWLLSKGYRVVGAELSELAIDQLFESLGIEPIITQGDPVIHYHAENIDIYVGDIFDLSASDLPPVDAIYDRAALVALPEIMRQQYTRHLMNMTGNATQLLITFEYEQHRMQGPPFSVSTDEVKRHYESTYDVSLLRNERKTDGFRGLADLSEQVWLLKRVV